VRRPHARDIDVDKAVNVNEVDDLVAGVVRPLAIGYEHAAQRKEIGATFGSLLAGQLQRFLQTHRSIRLLMGNREENFAGLSDAMSLAREQVERIYIVTLLLENPKQWTVRYFKDDWRKEYERYLLERDERSGLERHEDFLSQWATSLEEDRVMFEISEKEKEFVELRYRHTTSEVRAKKKEDLGLREAERSIAHFPMPAEVIKEVSDGQLKGLLSRWYKEYGFFSAYTHGGFRKLLPAQMGEGRVSLSTSQKEKVINTEYFQAIVYSWLAAASACAVATSKKLPRRDGSSRALDDLELLVRLANLWDLMREISLPGKALWEAGARHFVVPTLGPTESTGSSRSA
jgi:hypothetical protein